MTLSLLATVPVQLVKRVMVGADELGKEIREDQVLATVGGVFYPAGTSTETTFQQDQVTVRPEVFLPDVDLTAVDAVNIGGVRYQVDGTPKLWPAAPFTGWQSPLPLQVTLLEVTG